MAKKARKVRSDIRVGNLEIKLGLEPGSIRNPDGTDARSNKKLATLRKEFSQAKNKVKTNPTITAKSIENATKALKSISTKKLTGSVETNLNNTSKVRKSKLGQATSSKNLSKSATTKLLKSAPKLETVKTTKPADKKVSKKLKK